MKIFAANWKLFKTPAETREFFSKFSEPASKIIAGSKGTEIVFFPPAVNLEATAQSVMGFKIQFGAQNSYFEAEGAFTGETSARTVQALGGEWVLLGHSERRKIFLENDELIAKKFAFVQRLGLKPMLCIGETLAEREAGKTLSVLQHQLRLGLAQADKKRSFAIAYEPVWAIGTGKVANLEQVGEAHAQVRAELSNSGFALQTPILYGGSVKPDNAKALINVPNVNGFLVGGASLEVKSFLEICQA
jgi:triosephosphate isomerase (TIM)